MRSGDLQAASARRHRRGRHDRRSLRTGRSFATLLAAIVAAEIVLSLWLVGAREHAAPDPLAIARRAEPVSDADLFQLHRALSHGAPHADLALVQALLAAPDGRVREFAASPTLAKFGWTEPVERAIAARRRPREAFRMRLWLYYQLGVHEPPRFLTIERIRDHFASLAEEARRRPAERRGLSLH